MQLLPCIIKIDRAYNLTGRYTYQNTALLLQLSGIFCFYQQSVAIHGPDHNHITLLLCVDVALAGFVRRQVNIHAY